MDPVLSKANQDRHFYNSVFDTLVGQDPTGQPIPMLAESWTISSDALVYTFKLRSGVKFHDGTPFDAAAAKASLDRILDPATGSPHRPDIERIKEVEAVDPQTLRLTLSEPLASLLIYMADRPGMIPSPTAIQSLGADFARKPVGTGPFKLTEWVQDSRITFERNADYWDAGKPHLDGVTIQIIPDDTVRFTTLQSGGLDLILNPPPQNLPPLRQPNAELKLIEQPSLSYHEIRLNVRKPPFDNKALRQAIWYGVDPAGAVKSVLLDNGVVAAGPLAPKSWSFDPTFERPGPDPAIAKQKLAEGGKPDGFEFVYNVRSQPVHVQMAELYAAQLSSLGIKMSIQVMEFAAVNEALISGNFEASDGVGANVADPDRLMYSYFVCDGAQNQTGYCNPAYDEIVTEARNVTDIEQRRALYAKAQQFIVDEAPRVATVYFNDNYLMTRKVDGLVLYADGMLRTRDISLTS